jgi:hypothetical protein
MSVSFNFPALSAISWLPVNFKTVGGDHVTKFEVLKTKDGATFGLNECLRNFKDTTFNKRTGMFLTDITTASKILEDSTSPEDYAPLTEIYSPICTVDRANDQIISISPKTRELYVTFRNATTIKGNIANVNTADNFRFIFFKDTTHTFANAEEDFVSISSAYYNQTNTSIPDQFFLTWNSSNNKLTFQPQIHPPSASQRFSYLKSNKGICLFKPDTNFSFIVDRVNSSDFPYGVFQFRDYLSESHSNYALPPSSFLKFVSYNDLVIKNKDIVDSHLTKYQINKLDYQQEILPDSQIKAQSYVQNFLGLFPVENPTLNKNHATYDLQIHGLKNYQTPEYNYSFNKNYIDGYSGAHRLYDRIFSGSNQREGLVNVHLGYSANTSEIKFLKDQETPFNFAPTSYRIPLSSAGLIEDGAIPGHHPFVSDRIYFKQMDYNGQIQGMPQPSSINKLSNTWLCAWLSGSETSNAVWMDRFYNSGYYTFEQALTADITTYRDRILPDQSYIIDTPSTMYLEPGAFYRYYHSGLQTSQNYVPFLDGSFNSTLGSKILHISSWDSNPLNDLSFNHNNGLVYPSNYINSEKDYWELTGSNHAIFPARTVLLEERHLTASLWVNTSDWSNIQGSQIFGNFYNSGFGLINETSLSAPLIAFGDKSTGQVYNLNYKFKIVNSSDTLFNNSVPNNNLIICRLPDFTYWTFDTKNGIGTKYDIEGRRIKTLSQRFLKIDQIEVDGDYNLYLYQSYKKRVSVLTAGGDLLTGISYRLKKHSVQRIELFKYKNIPQISIIEIFGNASVIDNENNIWQCLGKNLYKSSYDPLTDLHSNPVFYATLGITQQITCDSHNNIWILHDQDKVSILKPSQQLFKTFRIGKRSGLPEDPCLTNTNRFRYINFVKIPQASIVDCASYNYEDLAVLLDIRDNELMLIDLNGDLITRLDLTSLYGLKSNKPIFCADGDFTGYQILRRFKSNNKNLSWKFYTAYTNGKNPQAFNLQYDTNLLHPGWHHFVFVFDAENESAKYYIDSVLVDEISIDPFRQLWFNYRSSLSLGVESVKNSNLNDLINIQDAYKFVGKIADLRLYNKPLSPGDISQLYFSFKYSDNRKPLLWNMTTGKRNYIEKIEHWLQLQLPGSKSKYFNINIHNFKATPDVQTIIEDAIRKNIAKLAPAYTSLYKINWL